MENSYPCECGHPKNMHKDAWAWLDGAAACMISNESPEYHLCVYRPDNLKFLEEKYVRSNQ